MPRTTLADVKASRIPSVANMSSSDLRFVPLINEAQERLVKSGELFQGLTQRVQFCVTDGCIVLPRQIASVESVALCDHPIPMRGKFFEFLETGVGLQGDGDCGSSCGGNQLLDRGETCCYNDIIGTDKKIKVYTDVAESASAVITLFGYDENNQWIRTFVGGVWVDGEQVSLSGGPHTTTKNFSSLTGVIKPITNGAVRLYEYDTVLLTQRDIAVYEPDETNPTYRKMFISGIDCSAGCAGCNENGEIQVTVMARLEFIPAKNDTDWMMIGNIPALKAEVQSILKNENNLVQESLAYHAMAIQTLRQEYRHYNGHGAVNPIRMAPSNISGPSVPNLV